MSVTIELVGFGGDRPAAFSGVDRLVVNADVSMAPIDILRDVGLGDGAGLVVLLNGKVASPETLSSGGIMAGDILTVMSALEGG